MLSFIKPALAQGITNPVLPFAGQGSGNIVLGNIIGAVIGILLVFGFIMALFHFIFGAFTWITSSGDKNKLQSAQDRITQAIVGLIIMAATWAIMMLIGGFLGINFPTLSLPSVENVDTTGGGDTVTNPPCNLPNACMTTTACFSSPTGQAISVCGANSENVCCFKPY